MRCPLFTDDAERKGLQMEWGAFLKRYRHINWALADQMLVSGVNFGTGVLLARHLGQAEFGRFTLIWMFVLLSNTMKTMMVTAPMMSIGPKQSREEAPAYYGVTCIHQALFAISTCLLFVVGFLLTHWGFPQWRLNTLGVPVAGVACIFQTQDFLRRYFFTRNRPLIAFGNDMISYGGQLAVLLWLFHSTTVRIQTVLWAIAATSLLAIGIGGFSLHPIAWPHGLLRTVLQRHWNFSKWLTASTLIQWPVMPLFLFTTSWLLGPAAVGGLKACQNIVGIMHIFYQGFENIVPIRAGHYFHSGGYRFLAAYLQKVTWIGGAFVGGMVMIIFLAPHVWLRVFYADEYLPYANILRWYCAFYMLGFFVLPLEAGLRAMEHTRPVFFAQAGLLPVGIITAYPFIAWWGINGTMVGLLTIGMVKVAILSYHYHKYLRSQGL